MSKPKIRKPRYKDLRIQARELLQQRKQFNREMQGAVGISVSVAFDAEGKVIAVGTNHESVARECIRLVREITEIQDFGVVS